MTLPNLFQQLGWLSGILPAVGLAVSFCFRRRSWVVFAWMPTMLFLAYAALWALTKIKLFGQVRGPDAIGVGFAVLFLAGMLVAIGVGLLLCYFARPRKEAWRLSTALPAVALCVGLSILVYTPQGAVLAGKVTSLHFIVSDVEGKPLPGVAVRVVTSEGGLGVGGTALSTGIEGQFMFQLREGQSAQIELHHPFPPSGNLSAMPTFWDIGVTAPRKGENAVIIRHSWQRSLGGHTFNEGFCELVPAATEVNLRVVLPPHSGLMGRLLREKIHASLVGPVGQQMGYSSVCRNIETVEYLPWLIENYRTNPSSRASLAKGICQVASILSELDEACSNLQDVAAHPSRHNQNYLDGEFSYEVAQLTTLAGVSGTDRKLALAQTRAMIAARAKILAEFVIAEAPANESFVEAFGELKRLGLPYLPTFFAMLNEHPPQKASTCQSWGHSLWRVVAREDKFEKLRPLFDSHQPASVLIACEAMGNQVDLVAPMILKPMQDARDAAHDQEVRQRLEFRINWMTDDLARETARRERAQQPVAN